MIVYIHWFLFTPNSIVSRICRIPISIPRRSTSTIVILLGAVQLHITRRGMAREHIIRRVSLRVSLILATEPARPTTRAVGIAVRRRGTETLLALVVTGEEELEEDRDQKEATVPISIVPFSELKILTSR